jgi:hypothetical protein
MYVEYTLYITTANPMIGVEEIDAVVRAMVGQLSEQMDSESRHGLDIDAERVFPGHVTGRYFDPAEPNEMSPNSSE